MRKAQDMVLSLPAATVSGSFRADLWERIRSGEGAPDLALREPIPFASKVRYVVSGAAAAACMLFVLHMARGEDAIEPRASEPESVTEVAKAKVDASPSSAYFGVVPITPQLAADTCVNTCATIVNQVQQGLPAIEDHSLPTMRGELMRAREAAGMLLWMDGDGFVQLDPDTANAFVLLRKIASRAEQAEGPTELRRALEPMRGLKLHNLRNVLVRCCIEPKFEQEFGQQVVSGAPWGGLFDIVVPNDFGDPQLRLFIRTRASRGAIPLNGGR